MPNGTPYPKELRAECFRTILDGESPAFGEKFPISLILTENNSEMALDEVIDLQCPSDMVCVLPPSHLTAPSLEYIIKPG